MNFLKAIALLTLPSLVAAQPGVTTCENFQLEIQDVHFVWKNELPNDAGRNIVKTPSGMGPFPEHQIDWGVASSGHVSGLVADSTALTFGFIMAGGPGNPGGGIFELGEITHINNGINGNTQINSLTLCVKIFTNHGDYEFNYDMTVRETSNRPGTNGCPFTSVTDCSDQILIINDPAPQEIYSLPVDFEFELDLAGFRSTSSGPLDTELITEEDQATSTKLWGSFFLVDCDGDGGGGGDPHFQTWTGHWYDFHGECDMHLLTASEFDGTTALTIDVRTKTRDWYSFIEAAAIKIGDDVLEVTGYGTHSFNGVEGTRLPKMMAGKYPVTYEMISKKTHVYTIAIEGDEKIVVRTFKDLVSVMVVNGREERFEKSGGLMGSFHTGQVWDRSGKHTLEDPSEIAREWQVRDTESMIFQDAHGPQYPQQCGMPKKQEIGGRLGKTIALAAAQEACAHWSAEKKDLCVSDVMKTGDVELAQEAAMY